jgi:KDO2-lipid IV(A) lauroyltransferase
MAKTIVRGLETAGVLALEKGIGSLPLGTASCMGAKLLRTIGPALGGASKTARRNLGRVFAPERVEELLPAVWGNLGRTFFEYPHLSTISHKGYVEFRGTEHLQKISAEGTGGVFFSGHLANWECLGLLADAAGVDAALMYRAPNNERVAEVLQRCRPSRRLRFIPKSTSGTKEAFSILANKGFVGILIDHRYNRGVEVDFLGGRAIIAPTVALMVQRYRCPLIPLRAERISPLHHRITAYEPIAIDWSLPPEQMTQSIMQSAMSLLESWILERPDQWFWMQRLWR